jgi:hypothetical protein
VNLRKPLNEPVGKILQVHTDVLLHLSKWLNTAT